MTLLFESKRMSTVPKKVVDELRAKEVRWSRSGPSHPWSTSSPTTLLSTGSRPRTGTADNLGRFIPSTCWIQRVHELGSDPDRASDAPRQRKDARMKPEHVRTAR